MIQYLLEADGEGIIVPLDRRFVVYPGGAGVEEGVGVKEGAGVEEGVD